MTLSFSSVVLLVMTCYSSEYCYCQLFHYLAIPWTTKLSIFLVAVLIGGHNILLQPHQHLLARL